MVQRKKACLYIASALIPLGVFVAALLALGAVPFGNESVIISDAKYQYIDFAVQWRSVLTGENDLFYTLSKTMGGNMLSLAAYYLLSPLNLIFLFATAENIPYLFTAVIAAKISLCGLTFFHASSRLYGSSGKLLLFSSSYALMAYSILFGWNIMWMDGPVVLPLLMLGLLRLMEGKAPWLYILSLAYSLAVNFYIGYMLCIASVMGFAAIAILKKSSPRELLGQAVRFGAGSLIGGLGSAAVWLPTFLSISSERSQTNAFRVTLETFPILSSFPSKFFCGAASPLEAASGATHVFCGTIVLLLVICFFLSRKTALREKLVAAAALLIFLGSFLFVLPDMIWHGFSPPNSFNFRYAFLFSFTLIFIAQDQFLRKDGPSARAILLSAGALAGLFCVALLRTMPFLRPLGVAASFLTLIAAAVFLLLRQKGRPCPFVLILAVGVLELGLNCVLSLSAITDHDWTLRMDEHRDFVRTVQPAVDYVHSRDEGLYRMEKTFSRSYNDASLLGYNGLSHFSSTEPVFVKPFMRKMGFATEQNFCASYSNGSTASADALLGVRYLLTREESAKTDGYELLTTQGGIQIYENPGALPLAFLSMPELSGLSTAEAADTFALQDQIWQRMTGQERSILLPESYTVSTVGLTATQNGDGSTTYTRTGPEEAALRYQLQITRELPLYFHIPNELRHFGVLPAAVYINGEYAGEYFTDFFWNMQCAGRFQVGETVTIELRPINDRLEIIEPYFYYEDTALLQELAQSLQAQAPTLTRLSSSHFQGSFTTEADRLLVFSFPFDKGWTLRIDGQAVPCQMVLDCLLAANVPAGTHSFDLRYVPQGFTLGCAISCAAVLAAAVWLWLRRRHSR